MADAQFPLSITSVVYRIADAELRVKFGDTYIANLWTEIADSRCQHPSGEVVALRNYFRPEVQVDMLAKFLTQI